MATRLYFTSNAFSGPVYPADAGWNDVTQCTTQSSDMSTLPSGDAHYAQTAQKNSASNPHTILHARFKLALPAGITLQGSVRGQFFAQCPGTLGAMRAISVRVFDSGTTLRANLVQHFPGSLSSGFPGTLQNRNFPPAAVIVAPYTTVAGDVLVVEVGAKWFTASSGVGVNAAIRFGDAGTVDLPVDETTGVSAPEQNGWIEFQDVNIFGGLNPFLMTASGAALVTRPAAPAETPGLHFVDIGTLTHYFWTGVQWDRLFPESLATFADRSKTLTLTDTVDGAELTASATWSSSLLGLRAPGADNPLLIGRWGNIGMAGNQPDDNTMLRFQKTDFNTASVARAIVGTIQNDGSGGATGWDGTIDNAGTSTAVTYGLKMTVKNSVAGATGNVYGTEFTVQQLGAGSRTNLYGHRLVVSNNGTLTGEAAGFVVSTLAGGAATPLVAGFKCASIVSGVVKRGLHSVQTNESTAGDWLASSFGKGPVMVDNQGTPHFWRLAAATDGTPYIADIGTSAPAA